MAIRFRHEARTLAMQALCQLDVQSEDFLPQLDDFLRDSASERASSGGVRLPSEAISLAASLAQGAWARRGDSDRRIAACSERWSVARMALVDRGILRLAVFELLEVPETPFKVVIDEALELAHEFSDVDSPSFINGVLDAVWRGIQSEIDGNCS